MENSRSEVMDDLRSARETVWLNPGLMSGGFAEASRIAGLGAEDIAEAEKRFERFAPFIRNRFPETAASGGRISSPLREISAMQGGICTQGRPGGDGVRPPGRLFLKMDSELAVAGSVKARGGFNEVLKHTEDVVREQGLYDGADIGDWLADPATRSLFAGWKVQVGSTGNLGISIGMMSAAAGYDAIVHMSSDARQWKKDKLRGSGVTVIEYDSDYSAAVRSGREQSDRDETSYFVDDENSVSLFLGYATAAQELRAQLAEAGIVPGAEAPLFVYIPCGVGGAPGGITFGLKAAFGDAVHCFFAEPVQAPCMLLGMCTGKHNGICVQDIGLTGSTEADGLAVGRPSGFVGRVMEPLVSGIVTVDDYRLGDYGKQLLGTEQIYIEPSACAGIRGYADYLTHRAFGEYLRTRGLGREQMENAVHVLWATGGSLVPPELR